MFLILKSTEDVTVFDLNQLQISEVVIIAQKT